MVVTSVIRTMRRVNRSKNRSMSVVNGEDTSFENVHRGLFLQRNVFDTVFVDKIISKMTKDAHFFTKKPHSSDEIDVHPDWMPTFPFEFQQAIHNKVNVPDIQQAFGFKDGISLEDLKTSFVVRYEKQSDFVENLREKQHHMQIMFSTHKDTPIESGKHVMSVIYSFTTEDFNGASIQFSNRDDGEQHDTRDFFTFHPLHNSIYIFNGSHVSHSGVGITVGCRWALVMFYETRQSLAEVVQLWSITKLPVTICEQCGGYFTNNRTYMRHFSRNKKHVVKNNANSLLTFT